MLVEQLWRRTLEHARWAIKPLVIGLAGVQAFDVFLYSDAMLFRHLDPEIWAARGVVHALVIPFVAIATARNTAWTVDLHLSRGVVFHSTALLASGVYLLVVAGAGYWVRFFGGNWGKTLQVAFVFAALLFLGAVVFSGTLRSRLRVFVSKHFFSYRYDYRQEWLGFTRVLAATRSGTALRRPARPRARGPGRKPWRGALAGAGRKALAGGAQRPARGQGGGARVGFARHLPRAHRLGGAARRVRARAGPLSRP